MNIICKALEGKLTHPHHAAALDIRHCGPEVHNHASSSEKLCLSPLAVCVNVHPNDNMCFVQYHHISLACYQPIKFALHSKYG